ncbi:hypothetical protein [Streptomyces sp. IBSBF 2950]|uniref:hypothetical protein n=1 Tax=Streptomyces sp. IBSBF 2950 TaxID=2903528 RepID=UPI002FDC2116
MSKKPTPSTEAAELRALLEAVLEAVTLPYDIGDHARRMETRADWVRATLKGALEEDPASIGWNASFLRSRIAAEEAEAAAKAAEAAERAKNQCKRCRKPFDPADTAFDGRARYRDTPHCRSCVDNCHDGGAEHVCVICEPNRYGGEGQ